MTTQDLRLEAALAEMAALITRSTAAGDGSHTTAVRGLAVYRASAPNSLHHGVHNPCICVIAQGAKRVMLGDEVYLYDRARYLAASVDLPVSGQVIEASAEKPYLSLKLDVDPREIAALLLEAPPQASDAAPARGLFMSRIGADLVEAFVRLLRLLDTPEDIPVLEAVVRREILYRMLKGEQGFRLRQIANASGHSTRIARSIDWLRRNFTQPLRIEELASQANMSPSSFHEHFRAMTAMSPLQFQKQLRLQEARQILLSESLDAATAGHRVGYESPSQFSREYSRLFGAPPATDMKRLRGAPEASQATA
jgi:AraC-like DNA-binding protein